MGFLRRHLFSLLIIGGAFIAYSFPGPFTEIHGFKCARLIVPMIQIIMFGMGTNLSLSDFAEALRRPPVFGDADARLPAGPAGGI